MLKARARKWVALHVAVDVAVTCLAWLLAYTLRFHEPLATLVPVTKGVPELSRYLLLLPLMALLWPPVLYFHGLYQIRRGRSRIDEGFAILFAVLLASALTLGTTLYVRVYYRFQPEVAPLWEYSQAVFALFALLDVLLLSVGRAGLRAWQERQWAAGENLTRVLVAGTGELGRTVAEALVTHRRLGYRVIGFLGEREASSGHAGLPVIGTIEDAREAVERSQADEVYVALPLEDHARLVPLVQGLSNECVDLKVVPDVVQYATIRAALEDLDGIPIISLNEVPLQGWSSMVKRVMDLLVSALLLTGLSDPVPGRCSRCWCAATAERGRCCCARSA